MADHLHNELKREFQLERMILFSDAVFAIAITLLVIEIKVPEIEKHEVNDHLLSVALDHLIPKFVGFFISFAIIGFYWVLHHRMFGYVVNYNNRTLGLNLVFLFAVALMPFSTAFYSEYMLRSLITPTMVYIFNIALLAIMNFLMWRHISNPKNKLAEGITPVEKRLYPLKASIFPVFFIAVAIMYVFDARLAVIIAPLFAVVIRIVRKLLIGKQKPASST
jgi:uncharacterized membrane protein